VRLRSQHNKFLTACDDEEGVKQTRHGSSKAARWAVETVEGKPNVIRLKSCQTWKYLSASDDHFLLGMTGKKVLQASPRARSDPIVEWEPLKEGSWVRLRTRKGNFLRANGGIPPWMNSVTHDVPSRSATQDWVLWMVDILEVDYQSGPLVKEDDGADHHDQTAGEGGNLDHEEGLSRSSSYSSTMNTVEKIGSDDRYEDCSEVGSPARSVHSSMEVCFCCKFSFIWFRSLFFDFCVDFVANCLPNSNFDCQPVADLTWGQCIIRHPLSQKKRSVEEFKKC